MLVCDVKPVEDEAVKEGAIVVGSAEAVIMSTEEGVIVLTSADVIGPVGFDVVYDVFVVPADADAPLVLDDVVADADRDAMDGVDPDEMVVVPADADAWLVLDGVVADAD